MKRVYGSLISEHLQELHQMALLTGPRQVGKTTTSRSSAGKHRYLTWDRQSDRSLIIRGADAVAEDIDLSTLTAQKKSIIFDEIHKYRKWKSFLKGFFDVYAERSRIIVTGSARLNIYKRGGDSLMGRYFLYRMHPLTMAELVSTVLVENEIRDPIKIQPGSVKQLLTFGGFPEPFLKDSMRFYNRWKRLRIEQLFREDLRDLTQIQESAQVQVLAEILANQVGQLVNYSSLAVAVNVSVDTIRRWISTLEALFFCYTIRPWFRNVPKSLRKQPKVYLWDWSLVPEDGARRENFIASHLLKAVHWWTDIGLGAYELYYLRDKAKREVDFLVTRNNKPWFLVEVKTSAKRSISPNLEYFRKQTRADHAFQVAFDLEFVEQNVFSEKSPIRIPVGTFLSQLV